ncbi:MAG: hypothetical protein M3R25_10595, partial [Bacteroidota bacterium]|nr:hypothetical protein [Bacteroidota bacterium]
MKTYLIPILLFFSLVVIHPAEAVNSEKSRKEKQEERQADNGEKKMDALSLVAYISAVTGIASLF